jgi:acyl carrier protein
MVPAAFVFVPAFPLSPNGKVDRAALPEPELVRPELATAYQAPRDRIEQAIARTWTQLLGIEQIGVNDNFFELGGHSLLMAELRSALQAALGRPLTIVELFQFPTVRSLAEHLATAGAASAEALASVRDRVESRRESRAHRQQAAAARRTRGKD